MSTSYGVQNIARSLFKIPCAIYRHRLELASYQHCRNPLSGTNYDKKTKRKDTIHIGRKHQQEDRLHFNVSG